MFSYFGSEFIAIAFLLVLIFQFKRIGTFLNLLKARLRDAEWQPAGRQQIPAYVRNILACGEVPLKAFGFELVGAFAAEPIHFFDPRQKIWAELYWHPEQAVLARLELGEQMNGQAFRISFFSYFTDGQTLQTINREAWAELPIPPDIISQDAYADRLEGQWRFHQNKVISLALNTPLIRERMPALRRHAEAGLKHYLRFLQSTAWVEPDQGLFKFTVKGAWLFARQLTGVPAAIRRKLSQPFHHDPKPDIRAQRMAELDTVATSIALTQQPYPAWLKFSLFGATLLLTAVLFGSRFGVGEAAALMVVLLIHELGHFAAMSAFGYRNLSIFFLPMLGAVAVGHKPHARTWQEVIVLLAGPVPGLILAFAVSQIPSALLPLWATEFLRSFVWFSLLLNLFNLLPFGALDGGRIFQLAILGRFPLAGVVFAALGALLGIAFAWWSESLIFGLAMLLLLSGIPAQLKTARVVSAIRANAPDVSKHGLSGSRAIAELGKEFARSNLGGDVANGRQLRVNIARLAYPRLLQGVPGLLTSAVTLVVQLLCLILPLLVVAWNIGADAPTPLYQVTAAEQATLDKRRLDSPAFRQSQAEFDRFVVEFQSEPVLLNRWDRLVAMEAAASESLTTPEQLKWLHDQRKLLAGQLPITHLARLEHELASIATGDRESLRQLAAALLAALEPPAESDHQEPLASDPANLQKIHLLLATWQRLSEETSAIDTADQIPTITGLWHRMPDDEIFIDLRSDVARVMAKLELAKGDKPAAKDWFQRIYPHSQNEVGSYAQLEEAWFLLDAGEAQAALTLAEAALQRDANENEIKGSRIPATWHTLAGWAQMQLGQAESADKHFQASSAERTHRLAQIQLSRPWWVRLLGIQSTSRKSHAQRITPDTLDHLAALQIYAPQQAEQQIAALRQANATRKDGPLSADNISADRKLQNRFLQRGQSGLIGGFGQARAAAHDELRHKLGLTEE